MPDLSALSATSTFDGVVQAHRNLLAALEAGQSIRAAVLDSYGWDLDEPIPGMMLGQIDQILVRRLNDFVPENDSPLILDCGANIGVSTLHFKRMFPRARIVAFEPDPSLFGLLTRNLERNGAADVRAVEAAVWIASGEQSFVGDGADGGRIQPDDATGTPVRTVDLKEYLQEPVDLLKVDIEGAEYAVLRHALGALKRVRHIVVECHIDQSTLSEFGQLLHKLRRAGFHITFDTFGQWRDLIRGVAVDRFHFEQYVAVYGRRSMPSPDAVSSCVPYVDLPSLLEFYRAAYPHDGPLRYRSVYGAVMAGSSGGENVSVEKPFQADGGRCWRAELPESIGQGDTEGHMSASRLALYEDGTLMGPPHCQHSAIRQYGGGRFSHWHSTLYFSTSDDSDPNTNGRTYTVALAESPSEPPSLAA